MATQDNSVVGTSAPDGDEEKDDLAGAMLQKATEGDATAGYVSPKTALRVMRDYVDDFAWAIERGDLATAVKLYEAGQVWDRDVLGPSGLRNVMEKGSRELRRNGDPLRAEEALKFTAKGFRAVSAEKKFPLDQFLDDATPEGQLAQNPGMSRALAEKLALLEQGQYTKEHGYSDVAKVAEIKRIIKRTKANDDLFNQKRLLDTLDASDTFLKTSFADSGVDGNELSHVAVRLARFSESAGVRFEQTAPAFEKLVEIGDVLLRTTEPAESTPQDPLGGVGPVNPPPKQKSLAFASDVIAFASKSAPTYAPQVMRLLSGGFIDAQELSDGMTAPAMAHALVSLAPALVEFEHYAATEFPESEIGFRESRQNLTRLLVHKLAESRGLGMFRPNQQTGQQADAVGDSLILTAVDGSDPMARVNMRAAAQNQTPDFVVSDLVAAAVEAKTWDAAQASRFNDAYAVVASVEGDPAAASLARAFAEPSGARVATALANKDSSGYKTTKLAAAVQVDKAIDASKSPAAAPIKPLGSVRDVLAAKLGIDPDNMTERERLALDKEERAYNEVWDNFAGPVLPVVARVTPPLVRGVISKMRPGEDAPDTARWLEQLSQSLKQHAAGAAALFTDETVSDARLRVATEGKVKIGSATLAYADLFPTDEAMQEFADRVSAVDVAGAVQLVKQAVDRGLVEGWLNWESGKLVNDKDLTAAKYRATQRRASDSSGGTSKVSVDADWIGQGVRLEGDMANPEDRAVVLGAFSFVPGPDGEANLERWNRQISGLRERGKAAARYPDAARDVKLGLSELMQVRSPGGARGGNRAAAERSASSVARRALRFFGAVDQHRFSSLEAQTRKAQAAEEQFKIATAEAKSRAALDQSAQRGRNVTAAIELMKTESGEGLSFEQAFERVSKAGEVSEEEVFPPGVPADESRFTSGPGGAYDMSVLLQ